MTSEIEVGELIAGHLRFGGRAGRDKRKHVLVRVRPGNHRGAERRDRGHASVLSHWLPAAARVLGFLFARTGANSGVSVIAEPTASASKLRRLAWARALTHELGTRRAAMARARACRRVSASTRLDRSSARGAISV